MRKIKNYDQTAHAMREWRARAISGWTAAGILTVAWFIRELFIEAAGR